MWRTGSATRWPTFTPETGAVASRAASGKVLNAIAPLVPELIGGSADLAGSNLTTVKEAPSFAPGRFAGRNMHFGIREHGMGSIMNGMALSRLWIPYGGTFLIFSDYCRPAIRLSALQQVRVVYVMTHDSIGLGEDGPTHQPVEHLMSLRAMPDLHVFRPADAVETARAEIASRIDILAAATFPASSCCRARAPASAASSAVSVRQSTLTPAAAVTRSP